MAAVSAGCVTPPCPPPAAAASAAESHQRTIARGDLPPEVAPGTLKEHPKILCSQSTDSSGLNTFNERLGDAVGVLKS